MLAIVVSSDLPCMLLEYSPPPVLNMMLRSMAAIRLLSHHEPVRCGHFFWTIATTEVTLAPAHLIVIVIIILAKPVYIAVSSLLNREVCSSDVFPTIVSAFPPPRC
jgi:hypothetical protein